MIIALVGSSPDHEPSHRIRGAGVYAQNLIDSLNKYYPEDKYLLCSSGSIPNSDITHYLYFEPFFRTLPILKRGKTIVTVHDLIPLVFPKYFPKGLKGSLKWQIQKRLLKRADAIITDSEASKKDIIKFTKVNEKRVRVIYLSAGEEFKRIKDALILRRIRVKYNLPEKFALYVGDVTWNKNLPRLLSAISEINLTLVMVGGALKRENFDTKNPWNQDLLKVQQLSEKDKRIIRLGFIGNEDLVCIYNLAQVFVSPSLYEGFGLPILEAMSCGCPVVASKKGSIPEAAGDSALYVDPYDVSDIANGIGEVFFNDSVAKKLSEKGLEQVKKFSWEKTAKKTHECYEELLNK